MLLVMISIIVTVFSTVCYYDTFSHVSTDIVTTELRFLSASIYKYQEFVKTTYLIWMLLSSFIEKFLEIVEEKLTLKRTHGVKFNPSLLFFR